MYLILLIPAIMFIIISQTQQFQGLWVIACQAWQLPSMRSLNCPRNAFYEHIFWIPPIILHSFHSVNVACPPQVIVDSKKNQGHFTLFSLIVTQNLGSSNKFKVLSVQLAVSFKAKTKKWEATLSWKNNRWICRQGHASCSAELRSNDTSLADNKS